jgi:FAD/FMN-containing dehydrogenase
MHKFCEQENEATEIWRIRDDIVQACLARGFTMKYDVSLASNHYYQVIESTRAFIKQINLFSQQEKQGMIVCGFGQVGDGNLHIRIVTQGW